MSAARRASTGRLAPGRARGRALGLATCAVTFLAGCSLDITDTEPDPVAVGSSRPGLSVRVELEVEEPETGLARVEIDVYFLTGTDGEGRPRTTASVSSPTFGSLTLDPEAHAGMIGIHWRGVDTVPLEGDTLRFTPPVVDGFAPFPEIVVPVGLELDPLEDIELAPGGEIELAARFFDDRVVDSAPVQDRWSVTLGDALSVSGRGAPPRIRLPGELVDGLELPADLRLWSSRVFAWDGEVSGAYPVQVMRSAAVHLTVTPMGSHP